MIVDRVAGNALTHRNLELLPERIAEVLCAAFVLHHHLVTAIAAVDKAMEQSLSRAWDTAGFVAVILAVIVADHELNSLIRCPVDVGGIDVPDVDTPLGFRQRLLNRRLTWAGPNCPGPTVGERPCIGWILQDRAHGGNSRPTPDDIAERVTSWH